VDCDASHFVTDQLALPGVKSGADLESERPDCVPDGEAASNASGRAIEGREEAIAGGVDLSPTIALQLLADRSVMPLEKVGPWAVTQLSCVLGGSLDVGEQDRCQNAIFHRSLFGAGQELPHRPEESLYVSAMEEMIFAWNFDKSGAVDVVGQVPSIVQMDVDVSDAMKHKRRNPDRL
jgi:hypothetical protein